MNTKDLDIGEYWVITNKGDITFSSHIYATSHNHAEELANIRNIGEVVEGVCDFKPIEDVVKINNYQDLLHYVCFLSFLGQSAGLVSIEETLGDLGVLHELIHFKNNDSSISSEDLTNKILNLQKLTSILTHDFDIINNILRKIRNEQ